MEGKIAAIWARVSSEGQNELSLDGQVHRVKAKLESLGYLVPRELIFKVVWTSLDLETCPEFQQLKQLLAGRRVNAVGSLDRDRLEANGLQRLTFLSDCRENDVELVVCQGAPFISEPEGQLVELALAIGKERSVRRAQIGAKQGLADRARLKGLPPTKTKVYGMEWRNGKFMPDRNYDSARLIWELALSGMKLKAICKELLARGIPTPRGSICWQTSTLHVILTNPVYPGRYAALRYEKVEPKQRRKNTFGKTSFKVKPVDQWHFIDGLVEQPMVNWQQFMAIQERLALNKQYASRNAKYDYLLRGLIECEVCYSRGIERHYYGVRRSHQEPAYVCSAMWAQTYGKRCPSKAICCSQMEQGVKTKVRHFLENPTVYLFQIQRRTGVIAKTMADIENSIKNNDREYQNTILDERDARQRLSPEAFEAEQKLIFTKRQWLKEENQRLNAKLANMRKYSVTKEMVDRMRDNLRTNLDRATNEDWRLIFQSLGTKVIAFEDGTWDVEINIPVPDLIIENTTPWYICP